MFHIDFAILTEDGPYKPKNDKTLLSVANKLDIEEKYTLSVVEPGLFSERGALLISGQIDGVELPATEFVLSDVPNDVLADIIANGASIVDAVTDVRIEFEIEEVATFA